MSYLNGGDFMWRYVLLVIIIGGLFIMYNHNARADVNLLKIDEHASFRQIDPGDAKEIMDTSKNCIVLDVRTPMEYEQGHINKAVLLPNEDIYEGNKQIAKLLPDKHQQILVYCRSGQRSMEASAKLAKMGYDNIYEFGGILDWPYEIVK